MSDTAWNPWAPSNNYWFNKYNILLEKLGIGTDPRVAVVSGIIYEDDIVDLLPFYSYDGFPDILDEGNWIADRIKSEYKKHKNRGLDWQKIAQAKIRLELKERIKDIK